MKTSFFKKISRISVLLWLILALLFPSPTLSQINLEISGNGTSSQNTVSLEQNQSTQITQSNTAEIQNQVTVVSQTGANQASQNNGSVAVQTGATATGITINNQLNSNQTNISSCCSQSQTAQISQNGENSQSEINVSQNTNYDISTSNIGNVSNTVSVVANTGGNMAGNNNGNVQISTGNVNLSLAVTTHANSNKVTAILGSPSLEVSVYGNGSESVNSISISKNLGLSISVLNTGHLHNDLDIALDTGHNQAVGNNGSLDIDTGDIVASIGLDNQFNSNEIIVSVCCETPPVPTPPPAPIGGGNGNGGGGNGNGGGSNGGNSDCGDPGDPACSTGDNGGLAMLSTAGKILGLSATGGQGKIFSLVFFILGLLCLQKGLKAIAEGLSGLTARADYRLSLRLTVTGRGGKVALKLSLGTPRPAKIHPQIVPA